jgi:hypothetical protein
MELERTSRILHHSQCANGDGRHWGGGNLLSRGAHLLGLYRLPVILLAMVKRSGHLLLLIAVGQVSSFCQDLNRNLSGNFAPSVEMKELLDFILAPAALLQETLVTSLDYSRWPESASPTVRCDAVLKLKFSHNSSPNALFATYLVSTNFYVIGVYWGEPHGRALTLSVYPPSLQLASDESIFSIGHSVVPQLRFSFEKPIAPANVFTNMFGDFPATNLRFSEQDYLVPRYSSLFSSLESDTYQIDKSKHLHSATFGANLSNQYRVKLNKDRDVVESIEFLSEDQKLLQKRWFLYGNPPVVSQLTDQIIFVSERSVPARLPGSGVVVNNSRGSTRLSEMRIPINRGNRLFQIKYELAVKSIALPKSISLIGPNSKSPMCVAVLSNFAVAQGNFAESRETILNAVGFTKSDKLYRKFLEAYWAKPPKEVERDDHEAINILIKDYSRSLENVELAQGLRIRNINILQELYRVAGNRELAQIFEIYLQEIQQSLGAEFVLVGGLNAVDVLVLQKRFSEADTLHHHWLGYVRQNCPPRVVIDFARNLLVNSQFVSAYRFLEGSQAIFQGELLAEALRMKRATLDLVIGSIEPSVNTSAGSDISAAYSDWMRQSEAFEKIMEQKKRDIVEKEVTGGSTKKGNTNEN